jgi:hypothetical protein
MMHAFAVSWNWRYREEQRPAEGAIGDDRFNQVERFFALITDKAIRRGSLTSVN